MKIFRYSIYALSLAAMAAGMASCQDDYDAPALDVPEASMQANMTIADFKALYSGEMAVKVATLNNDGKTPIVLHGRVITSDASGNIYKSLVIQDETAAMPFSINKSNLSGIYRPGQEIVVNATDLWVGKYNNYLQFGMYGEYNGMPQITFMGYDEFTSHIELNGLPDSEIKYVKYGTEYPSNSPYCIVIDMATLMDIPASGAPFWNIMGQLVEIPNVSFVAAGQDPPVKFAPYQESADRYVKDATGKTTKTLNVRCSGYSTFYDVDLPSGVGTIRGILSRYGDSWQLVMRDLDDAMFDSKGSRNDPYSVEEAIAMNDNGRISWVEGTIIGCVKFGVSPAVESIDDIIFDVAKVDADNNVVIAPSKDCRDLSQMMVVNLPAGSKAREYLNLNDNPERLGKTLKVEGAFKQWLGMHGVTDLGSGFTTFEVEGLDLSELLGTGTGTEEDPYSVNYIINTPGEEMSEVWVTGYIVGFVSGTDISTGAVFSDDTSGADYSGNNVLISERVDASEPSQVVPVALSGAFRSEFSLKRHPENYKKKVLIKANVGEVSVYGSRGIVTVHEMKVVE